MLEGGAWILIIEGLAVGVLFIGLIWWVVGGSLKRDRDRLREYDEKQAAEQHKASETATSATDKD